MKGSSCAVLFCLWSFVIFWLKWFCCGGEGVVSTVEQLVWRLWWVVEMLSWVWVVKMTMNSGEMKVLSDVVSLLLGEKWFMQEYVFGGFTWKCTWREEGCVIARVWLLWVRWSEDGVIMSVVHVKWYWVLSRKRKKMCTNFMQNLNHLLNFSFFHFFNTERV